jgi:uncharacterized CHY-type Zn-finger protein
MNKCKKCRNKASYCPTERRRKHAKEKYNMSLEEYNTTIDNATNCGICNNILTIKHLDHCHTTGKVREVLCPNCNKALGLMKDNPTALRKAAEYVEKFMLEEFISG